MKSFKNFDKLLKRTQEFVRKKKIKEKDVNKVIEKIASKSKLTENNAKEISDKIKISIAKRHNLTR